jgi:hypothetical protein
VEKEYGRRGRQGNTGTKVYIKNVENSSLILNGDHSSKMQMKQYEENLGHASCKQHNILVQVIGAYGSEQSS